MEKQIISSKSAPSPIGPYSQGVMFGNMLFLSGQIAIDPKDGKLKMDTLEEETRLVMANVGALLREAGLEYSNIIKTSIFLKSMNDFAQVNEIYGSYFEGDFPARETVEVSKLPKGVNVEISVIAAG